MRMYQLGRWLGTKKWFLPCPFPPSSHVPSNFAKKFQLQEASLEHCRQAQDGGTDSAGSREGDSVDAIAAA